MIAVLDEIQVRAGCAARYESAYRERYMPLARARGMTLEQALMAPPLPMADSAQTLLYIWSLPDPAAWWRMRYGAYDPQVRQFWAETAALVLERRRLYLGSLPQALEPPA